MILTLFPSYKGLDSAPRFEDSRIIKNASKNPNDLGIAKYLLIALFEQPVLF
jgi:hypothetical protein